MTVCLSDCQYIQFTYPISMHDIICPHRSKAFKIDEAGYADILKQVRDNAFEQEKRDAIVLVEVKGRAVLLTNS